MSDHRRVSVSWLLLAVVAPLALADERSPSPAGGASAAQLEFKETIVAGGPEAFVEVRHLFLRGSDYEIGRKLGEIAKVRHGVEPMRFRNSRRTRVQLRYLKRYYPAYVERMRGAAAAYGTSLDNTALNFSGLYFGVQLPGCSAVFYPPQTAADGGGVLSRNFEFSLGTVLGTKPPKGQLPACARPYVIEMYPDKGYASLVTCSFDLLGGVVDGINSEGLTVGVLADGEVIDKRGLKPSRLPQAGFNEIHIVRYLLDTCADTDEAKDALLEARLYYNLVPNHYIIADRRGQSFIWENHTEMRRGYIIPGRGKPQVTTNFMLHLHRDLEQLPEEFDRFRAIQQRLADHDGKFDTGFVKETNRCVSLTQPPPQDPYVPGRTLWHALYYPQERRVEIDFYLDEEPDPESPGEVRIRRSGYRSFALKLN